MAKALLRSDRKKQLYKLVVAQTDVIAAATSCNLFREKVDSLGHPLYYPLFVSIVSCYGRPFSDNKPLGRLPRQWEVFGDNGLQKMHNDIIHARNKIIAHSDLSERKVMIVPPRAEMAPFNKNSEHVGFAVSSYYFPLPAFEIIQATCADIGTRLMDAIDRELEELYGKIELPKEKFLLDFSTGI